MTASLLGVRLRVHPSWLLIFGLIVISLAAMGLPETVPDGDPLRWLLGVAVAGLFFVSVVLHELAHALIARRRGLEPGEVNVLVLGGNATLEQQAPDARSEAIIALAGPLASLALAGLFLLGWLLTNTLAGSVGLLVSATSGWLVLSNLLLGGFNLLPGFPMDGGRILRAGLWALTGDFLRATRLASYVGRGLGYGLIAVGLALVISGEPLMGLWLALIGWFLNRATEAAYRRVELRLLVANLALDDVMERDIAAVGPNLTLDTLVEQHEMSSRSSFYPVTLGGELVGTVDLRQVKRVPRGDWPVTRVIDVMARGERMLAMTEPVSVMDVLLRLEQSGSAGVPVVAQHEPRRLLGLVTRESLARAIRRRAALHQGGAAQ